MSRIILDDCLLYLYEAEKCLADYKEIDSYMEIFEAENPEVKEQMAKNEKAASGAIANIKKAAKAVLDMMRKLIASIGDFIRKRSMSADEREAFEKFKEMAKKDPSLRNKKITVRSYEKLQQEYEDLLKDVEKEEKLAQAGKEGNAEGLIKRIGNFCSNAGKGAVTAVSAETALRMASSSRELAKIMYDKLEKDEKFYAQMVERIGEKQTAKLAKDLKSLSRAISLKRAKMKLMHTYANSCEDAVMSTVGGFKDLFKGDLGKKVTSAVKNKGVVEKMGGNKEIAATVNAVKTGAVVAGKTAFKAAKAEHKIRKTEEKYEKDVNKAKAKVEAKKAKAEKRGKKLSEKELDYRNYMKSSKKKAKSNQSAIEALVGANDPNSIYNKTIGKHIGNVFK